MSRDGFITHWGSVFQEEAVPELRLEPFGPDGVMLYDGGQLVRAWGAYTLHGTAQFLAGFILGRKTGPRVRVPPSSP